MIRGLVKNDKNRPLIYFFIAFLTLYCIQSFEIKNVCYEVKI